MIAPTWWPLEFKLKQLFILTDQIFTHKFDFVFKRKFLDK